MGSARSGLVRFRGEEGMREVGDTDDDAGQHNGCIKGGSDEDPI